MLKRISQTIDRLASARNVLLLFLSLLPFVFILFPWRARLLSAGRPALPPVLDVRIPYTPAQVRALATDLGLEGRRLYALTELTLDLAFPPLYASWLSLTLAWAWRKIRPEWAGPHWNLLPYAGMLGDLAENAGAVTLMLLLPQAPGWVVWPANLASLLKWSAGLASLGLILAGAGLHFLRLLGPRR
jgi:hypothetical protein